MADSGKPPSFAAVGSEERVLLPAVSYLAIPDCERFLLPHKSHRVLSRTGLLLHYAVDQLWRGAPYSRDATRVGVYSAVNPGAPDFAALKGMPPEMSPEFTQAFLGYPPKQYLKSLVSTAAAQLGIHFGFQGPIFTYHDPSFACEHALSQAEFDLRSGRVGAAIIASAFAVEDPLLVQSLQLSRERVLAEGAAAVLLRPGDSFSLAGFRQSVFCGIADPLVSECLREEGGGA
jgi:hypothetical protein